MVWICFATFLLIINPTPCLLYSNYNSVFDVCRCILCLSRPPWVRRCSCGLSQLHFGHFETFSISGSLLGHWRLLSFIITADEINNTNNSCSYYKIIIVNFNAVVGLILLVLKCLLLSFPSWPVRWKWYNYCQNMCITHSSKLLCNFNFSFSSCLDAVNNLQPSLGEQINWRQQ